MEKHASKDDMVKNYENLLAKINALEVSAKDDYQKNIINYTTSKFEDVSWVTTYGAI